MDVALVKMFEKHVGMNFQSSEIYNWTTGKQKKGKPNLIYGVLWRCISQSEKLMYSMFTQSFPYPIITHWHIDQIVRCSVGFLNFKIIVLLYFVSV